MLPADATSQDRETQSAYIAKSLKTCVAALGTTQADAILCKSHRPVVAEYN